MNTRFNNWIDTLVLEKGVDLEQSFTVEGELGANYIPYAVIVEHMKIATTAEQKDIKDILVKIDYCNGDILHFFRHLGQAIAK